MKIDLGKREYILEILNYQYVIPFEYHECIKQAIKKYATNQKYSDSVIEIMINKPKV